MLTDQFHLLFEDGASGVAGEYEEGVNGTLASVKIFVKAASFGLLAGATC